MVYKLLSGVSALQSLIKNDIDMMKETPLDDTAAHHLMVMSVRQNALPASKIPKVIEAWDGGLADQPQRTAWNLYNAFTGVQKTRSPREQMDGTLRLTQLFRTALRLASVGRGP